MRSPEVGDTSAAAGTSESSIPRGDIFVTQSELFGTLFDLFDRKKCGHIDEEAMTQALRSAVRTDEAAHKLIARVSEDGIIDADCFRKLIERCVPAVADGEAAEARHGRLVKLILAIVKKYEKDAIANKDFYPAAEAREAYSTIHDSEETRLRRSIKERQSGDRVGLQQSQMVEAIEFNRQWTVNMDEFEKRASLVVEALRARHEEALAAAAAEFSQAKFARHSKETLDAMRIQQQLVHRGDYVLGSRYAKRVSSLLRKDEAAAGKLLEAEKLKKLEVIRWHQKLELRGLLLRIERTRRGHRLHWSQGANRLVMAQRNTMRELTSRQCRESNRTSTEVRTQLEPLIHPRPPAGAARAGSSPRARPTALVAAEASPFFKLPAPTQRPSKMAALAAAEGGRAGSARACNSVASSVGGSALLPYAGVRPVTSEHVPRLALSAHGA